MSANQLLKQNDKKFRLLFEEHPQPMWVSDAENERILEVNNAAASLYEYSPDELRSLRLSDLLLPDEPQRPLQRESAEAAGVRVPITVRHRTKSGRVIQVEIAVHDIQYGGRDAKLAVLAGHHGPHAIGGSAPAGPEDGSSWYAGRRRGARL